MKTPPSWLKHHPKPPTPNTIILVVRISTFELCGHKQSDHSSLLTTFPVFILAFLQANSPHNSQSQHLKGIWDLLNPTMTSHLTHSKSPQSIQWLTKPTWFDLCLLWPHLLLSPCLDLLQPHYPPCFVLYCFCKYCSHVCILDISISYNPSAWNVFLSNICIAHSLTSLRFLLKHVLSESWLMADYHV